MTLIVNPTPASAGGNAVPVPQSAPAPDAQRPRPAAPNPRTSQPRAATIAVVDDESLNIQIVQKYLQDAGYQKFVTSTKSTQAVDLVLTERPDLLLLDVMMPVVDGLQILREIRATPAIEHLPVLILTAASDATIKRKALYLGATDFLQKPVDPHDLVPRVRNALLTKAYQDRLARENAKLEEYVRRRTTELAASREELVHCLARAAQHRDDDTGYHIMRVGKYVGVMARQLGYSEAQVELLELAAQLHDLGKIAVSDSILGQPDTLDPERFDLIRNHSALVAKVVQPLSDEHWQSLRSHARLGASLLHVRSSPLLMLAAKIAQTHHERFDGSGYPLGLSGEDIPIEGRLTALADAYDTLSAGRTYKEPFSREKCFAILDQGRGTRFDPGVLDAFFARQDDIVKIQIQYMDVD